MPDSGNFFAGCARSQINQNLQTKSYENMKTVIVEDDSTCRCWLRGVVRKLGFSVVAEAANGGEAIAAVVRTQPELVLLDVSMPFQTGLQALPEILAACPGVRVVMVTSIADQGTVTECLEKGAAGYIRKDASLAEIDRLLAELREEVTPPQLPGVPHARL